MRLEFNENWMMKTSSSEWKQVTIPHDAMLEETRDAEAKGSSASGFFHGGRYTYQKKISLSKEELDLHYTLEFGGVYKNAVVSINGHKAGACAYGYRSFQIELDSFLKEGMNYITVEVDNLNQPDSRWYTGAGIYRSVYLWIQQKQHLFPKQIRIQTMQIKPARFAIQVGHIGGEVHVQVTDPNTKQVLVSGQGDNLEFESKEMILWSSENPYLYDIQVQLKDKDEIIEELHFAYGIRKIEKRAEGLYLNNQKLLLKGGCIHHDNGILGAREYKESAERKIRILKENGFNAIRSAHNPCSEEILNACDKYGIYVMDETWDMWYRKKSTYDYANDFENNYKDDILAMVEKDYNHPSVILYSIGNEVSEPAEQRGVQLTQEMVELLHKTDPTRLVTAGFNLMIIANAAKGKQMYQDEGGLNNFKNKDTSSINSTIFNMLASMAGSGMNKAANGKKADFAVTPALNILDVAGYNYSSGRYVEDLKKHPERLIIGSETFPQDLAKNWKMIKRLPNIVGDFMWTAWDYIGEAGLGAWTYEKDAKGFAKPYPWLLADCGVFDILGNPSGEALWTKIIWEKHATPEIAVRPCNHPKDKLIKAAWRGTNAIPSWSWSGCEGNRTIIEVYANASLAELYLNGNKIGRRKIKHGKAKFSVKYKPGKLETVVFDRFGTATGKKELCSGIGNIKPTISIETVNMETDYLKAGIICYVDVNMCCENGIIDSNSDEQLNLEVINGELLAFGSANPRTEDSFLSGCYRTYYGKAQAVIRVGNAEELVIIAHSGNRQYQKAIPIIEG